VADEESQVADLELRFFQCHAERRGRQFRIGMTRTGHLVTGIEVTADVPSLDPERSANLVPRRDMGNAESLLYACQELGVRNG
jgi:hypothetical protein